MHLTGLSQIVRSRALEHESRTAEEQESKRTGEQGSRRAGELESRRAGELKSRRAEELQSRRAAPDSARLVLSLLSSSPALQQESRESASHALSGPALLLSSSSALLLSSSPALQLSSSPALQLKRRGVATMNVPRRFPTLSHKVSGKHVHTSVCTLTIHDIYGA